LPSSEDEGFHDDDNVLRTLTTSLDGSTRSHRKLNPSKGPQEAQLHADPPEICDERAAVRAPLSHRTVADRSVRSVFAAKH
jgi:hypothetical protein